MVTQSQKDAAYHCGIGDLLSAAYQRDFTMLERGKCKTRFPTFNEWYATLNKEQAARVDASLKLQYKCSKFDSPSPASDIGRHLKDSHKLTPEEAGQPTEESDQSGNSDFAIEPIELDPNKFLPEKPGPYAQSSDGSITQPMSRKRRGR